jgi:hypothetical protein
LFKINRKQKAHKKARKTKKKRDVDRYKRLQQEVQYEVRQANKKYMEDVSTDYKENSKKFWSFIKSKGQEWTCFVLRLSKRAKVIQYLSFRCFEMRFQMILDLRRLQSN